MSRRLLGAEGRDAFELFRFINSIIDNIESWELIKRLLLGIMFCNQDEYQNYIKIYPTVFAKGLNEIKASCYVLRKRLIMEYV